ncbi:MAG TPA: hypothetical protein VNB94_10525, partial [Mycobacteriales bacterium]|nr:hypothetical protein [Mycobacteriales bacterium]
MRSRLGASLLAALLLAAAAPAAAQRPASGSRIEYAAPGIVRGDLGSGAGSALDAARRALAAHGGRLGVDPAGFRFETVRRSLIGTHVRGREFRG